MASLYKEKKRILLVEDEEDAKELVAYTLPEYTHICARDFSEGLRLARRGYFDLYILDSWLPDASGVELCRFIREFDSHKPILFYSAAADAAEFMRCLNAICEEGDARYRQVAASYYYQEIAEHGVAPVLKEMALLAMQLTPLNPVTEEAESDPEVIYALYAESESRSLFDREVA